MQTSIPPISVIGAFVFIRFNSMPGELVLNCDVTALPENAHISVLPVVSYNDKIV